MADPLEQDQEILDAEGRTIADRVDDEQAEMFPMGTISGDSKVSLKTLIKAGQRVEQTVSLMRGEVPLRHGMPDPTKSGRALVSYEFAKTEVVPEREDGKIVAWKNRTSLRPVFVEGFPSDDAEAIELLFVTLLEASPSAAGGVVDRLAAKVKEALAHA